MNQNPPPGVRLKRARLMADLTQIRLAQLAGFSASRICGIEKGYIKVSKDEIATLRAAIKRAKTGVV